MTDTTRMPLGEIAGLLEDCRRALPVGDYPETRQHCARAAATLRALDEALRPMLHAHDAWFCAGVMAGCSDRDDAANAAAYREFVRVADKTCEALRLLSTPTPAPSGQRN